MKDSVEPSLTQDFQNNLSQTADIPNTKIIPENQLLDQQANSTFVQLTNNVTKIKEYQASNGNISTPFLKVGGLHLRYGGSSISVNGYVDMEIPQIIQELSTIYPEISEDCQNILNQYERTTKAAQESGKDNYLDVSLPQFSVFTAIGRERNGSKNQVELTLKINPNKNILSQIVPFAHIDNKNSSQIQDAKSTEETVIQELINGNLELEGLLDELKMLDQKRAFVSEAIKSAQRKRKVIASIPEPIRTSSAENIGRLLINEFNKIQGLVNKISESDRKNQIDIFNHSIPVQEVLSPNYWGNIIEWSSQMIESNQLELIHNMGGLNALEYSLENGIGRVTKIPSTVTANNLDPIQEYSSYITDSSIPITYSILGIDAPPYINGSHQGDKSVQVRIPLTQKIIDRTIFFPSDTGDNQSRLSIEMDSMSSEERQKSVMTVQDAASLFLARHTQVVLLALLKKIPMENIRLGDHFIIEGNTFNQIPINKEHITKCIANKTTDQSSIDELSKRSIPVERI